VLTFTGRGAETGGAAPKAAVSFTGTVYRLAGVDEEGKLVLNSVRPGQSSATSLALAVEPEVPFTLAASALQGPAEATLEIQVEENTLSVAVPPLSAPGGYRGTLTVSFGELGLAAREIPTALEVEPAVAGLTVAPRNLVLTMTDKRGWAEGKLKVSYTFIDEAALEMTASDLTGEKNAFTINSDFDLQIRPLEGWDGKSLVPGKTYTLRYKAYVNSDMRDDRYIGELKLTSRYQGKVQKTVPIKVVVEVKRKR
jgi:hypothetical protein